MTNFKTNIYKQDLPDNLKLGKVIAIDSETLGLNNQRDRLCLVQLKDESDNVHLVQFSKDNYDAPNLKKLLLDKNILKIFHYGRFDIAVFYKYLNVMTNNIYCTKIASKLARTYTSSHGYKDICAELIGVDISKQQQCSYWGNDELSQAQINYASTDVIHLHALKAKLDEMLKREGRTDLLQPCFEFLPHRVLLDLKGWDKDIFSH